MSETSLTIPQVLTMLTAAPERITAFTTGLPAKALRTAPAPGEWSAVEVLAHMRSCADVWGGCIAEIIARDAPVLRAINPRTWIKSTGYPDLEFEPSLQAYTAQRAALLAVLQALPPLAWNRTATVTGAGKTLVRSVYFYAHWLAKHERPHLKQIGRIAGFFIINPL
jgi:hypothetical protein